MATNSQEYEDVVSCWVPDEKGAVHVKVISLPSGDPVDLSADEARSLAQRLIELSKEVE